jgi:hypothetical protein
MQPTGRKTAVLIIHGIGEQKPMATLRSFVDGVLQHIERERQKERDAKAEANPEPEPEPDTNRPLYWSKPDNISGSFELRRLNSYLGHRHPPIDFLEFYWAPLMSGNALNQSLEWLSMLLLRRPGRVPPSLFKYWMLIWAGVLAAVLGTLWFQDWKPAGYTALGLAAMITLAKMLARDWVGDAARYFNPKPHNVAVRQAIREAGVTVLTKLHQSGDYRRVVIVGHSLGSAIALDIIYQYWVQVHEAHGSPDQPKQPALEALETAIIDGSTNDLKTFRNMQRAAGKELREIGISWLVTDLITLGSPLTNLPYLTGLDKKEFSDRLEQRELPKCPPVLDDGAISYSVPYKQANGEPYNLRILHHAACFGPTRWTNIYFPHSGLLKGDPVGGPLKQHFGFGVWDRQVKTARWGGRLNHLDYWRYDHRDVDPNSSPLNVLVEALDLRESGRD